MLFHEMNGIIAPHPELKVRSGIFRYKGWVGVPAKKKCIYLGNNELGIDKNFGVLLQENDLSCAILYFAVFPLGLCL